MMVVNHLKDNCRCLVSGGVLSSKLPKWTEQVYNIPIQCSRIPDQYRHCEYEIGLQQPSPPNVASGPQ